MKSAEVEKILDSFKLINEENGYQSASIFIAPVEHSLNKKLLKRDLSKINKDGWKIVHRADDSDDFKAYFNNKRQILHLNELGNDAIKQSVTDKMFTHKEEDSINSILDSIENSGTMFELLPQPEKNFINKDLYFDADHYAGMRYHFTINWVHLWLFNTGIGMLSFKAKLIRVEDKSSGVSYQTDIGHIAKFNRCMRCKHEITDKKVSFYTYEDQKISESHFFKDIAIDNWLKNSPNSSSMILALDSESIDQKLLQNQYSHMRVLTWAYLNPYRKDGKINQDRKVLWNMPNVWPEHGYESIDSSLFEKDWGALASSLHFANMEGYPSIKDYLLYDLAETGEYLSSWRENNVWALNPEYLKSLLQNQHIEVFAEKDGLAVKEALAFISTRTPETMDPNLLLAEEWESLHYPLYIFMLHVDAAINKFEKLTTNAYKAPERYLQRTKDFQKFRNTFWFHQYGSRNTSRVIANKINLALDIDERFEHIEKEMQEVSNSIVQATQQIKSILITMILILVYPIWLWVDANQMLDNLKILFVEKPIESLGLISLTIVVVPIFYMIFDKQIKNTISFIWSKLLSVRYHDE